MTELWRLNAAQLAAGYRSGAFTPGEALDACLARVTEWAAGLPTSWGSQLLHGFVARRNELPVARLRAAGAVIFGKTTLPEFAMQDTPAIWSSVSPAIPGTRP